MTVASGQEVSMDAGQRPGNGAADGEPRVTYLRRAMEWVLAENQEFARTSHAFACQMHPESNPVDFILGTDGDPVTPAEIFWLLRWGGQYVYVSEDAAKVAQVMRGFNHVGGFVIEAGPDVVRTRLCGLALPFLTTRHHYVIARKTLLVPPGQSSDRFTYHVELLRSRHFGNDYVVMKQVPEAQRVKARLREKFPDAADSELDKRARKFTERVFPIFLTREAGILTVLQRKLPEPVRSRVPRVLGLEKDSQGLVRTMYVNWLRNGVNEKPLTQWEFAYQAADLLRALHEQAEVIHLDLRLDNVVVTPRGVGFVDFGSSVRIGEQLDESPLLSTLFGEMMRTSQIQRMMGKMQESGQLTSSEIRNSYHKVDKAVDFFYLAVQINAPLLNPDFRGLVTCDRNSIEAQRISALTAEILRPSNPLQPSVRTAGDIVAALARMGAGIAS